MGWVAWCSSAGVGGAHELVILGRKFEAPHPPTNTLLRRRIHRWRLTSAAAPWDFAPHHAPHEEEK